MLSIFSYRLPFRQPLITGSGVIDYRKGYLIHFESSHCSVITEASPLPGFSTESFGEVGNALKKHQNELDSFFTKDFTVNQLKEFLEKLPKLPSLQFAISYMGIELWLKKKHHTIEQLFDSVPSPIVKVNAMTGSLPERELLRAITSGYNSGIRTFKVKAPFPPDGLASTLANAAEIFPSISFRLDANRSWQYDQFESAVDKFKNLPIEYIEEPLQFMDPENIPESVLNSVIPVALDETVATIGNLELVLNNHPGLIVIIKPTILGNIFHFYETIVRYRSLLNDIVVTTTLESAVGRRMVATIAALMGDPQKAHGLNTGYLFKKDVSKSPIIENGLLKTEKGFFNSFKLTDLDPGLIYRQD
jgi:o-succinylbenzoate synthase